ncbi:small nuclear ribonucleoprotein [Cordyceps fumosorosea ARSEF 2679]|uniref:Small nuclear ribonucleoprotein n=1 Tax=Cordyceps fumosorosea (strain ARSEF 2679) TaxID=1081104 RepID=A0A168AN93_CORFA|nr:small nuclear ribonucleoprotein [Cordyceps fumosorosea ARSEF 2679]OAA68967.1 small nuclear ribonucleoprotein [Cordyceps fumosorosea ARSEF 2679]
MNAADEDLDNKLQKISTDLLADLDKALVTHIRKPDGSGGTRVRSFVRAREAFAATCDVIDNFQELPQLLDPHLPKWIPFLAQSYLEDLTTPRRTAARRDGGARSKALVPVAFAIAKILYTFCKVRGEKVIVRFLNAEAKYLELLLSSIEEAELQAAAAAADSTHLDPSDSLSATPARGWAWEQRYIVLLWLSHLLFAPFDLATISSVEFEEDAAPRVEGLRLRETLPGITLRILPLAVKYLATASRERDAAKALLVRLAMRRDMQALGVLDSLVDWAVVSLRPQDGAAPRPAYFYLGILSFLAGILRSSSETSDMNTHLSTVFNAVHALTFNDTDVSKAVNALALARKMIIKVIRSVVVTSLRRSSQDMQSMEMTETAIGYLLESLSDNDTPVRMSASKSLSVITLKLDPDMASQVVEAVLESLNRNVLWNKDEIKKGGRPVRDLSAVNHLEWHGLVLTLSHLLYQRSPPANQLSDIIHALLLGLSFEQRSLAGTSVGANVRDAACFGVWAIARRYATAELLAVPTRSVFAAKAHPPDSSILQVLATELVTAACLDPFGNIRRGASAALQELIGRHPDTVEQGIAVVQSVDYHAVARRSRAVRQVVLSATRLASQYGDSLLHGILGWRGVGDMDAPSRRDSGVAFGALTTVMREHSTQEDVGRFEMSLKMVLTRLEGLATRQVEERHGLLLCLASILDQFSGFQNSGAASIHTATAAVTAVCHVLQDCHETTYRRPELIAEAASRVAVSATPLLQVLIGYNGFEDKVEPGAEFLSPRCSGTYVVDFLNAVRKHVPRNPVLVLFVEKLADLITAWLDFPEPETVEAASTTALLLLVLSTDEDRTRRLLEWAKLVQHRPASRATIIGQGYFHALAMAQPLAEATSHHAEWDDVVSEAFVARWIADRQVETRVSLLQSLTRTQVLRSKPLAFLPLLADGLNDYTTNARGDVGSQVRVQALKAVQVLWAEIGETTGEEEWVVQSVRKLFYSTLRLSAEKLDKVRPEAQLALSLTMQESETSSLNDLSTSSQQYFTTLLELLSHGKLLPSVAATATADPDSWTSQLMAGLVTSADTGQEDLVVTSRAALTAFCQARPEHLQQACGALVRNLAEYRAEDRVVVPTLEVLAYLFHTGLPLRRSGGVGLRGLCLQTQKAGYKTGNVRKILACVRVYGCVVAEEGKEGDGGPAEARRRLAALFYHPWPRVRMAVVDELWGLMDGSGEGKGGSADVLLGVDWGKADKGSVKTVVEKLQLV